MGVVAAAAWIGNGMLDELRAVHAELEAAMDALDQLTTEPAPDQSAVANARARLGKASGKRRALFDMATNYLIKAGADPDKIRQLRELNAAQLESSTTHIGAWGLRQLVADWPGYVRTAAPMRQSMRDLIAADRKTLFPMLEKAG
jgi:ABC-type transporter Mla subunit MlaD